MGWPWSLGKPIGFLAVVASIFYGVYFVSDVLPERKLRAELPNQLNSSLSAIVNTAQNPEVIAQAKLTASSAEQALSAQNFSEAQPLIASLQNVHERLQQDYSIRIISRPGEKSGVFRTPPNNPTGRNYYLIVEAIDNNNRVLELTISNQEDNTVALKKTWGLRVSEETFFKIAADKDDDGIIQANTVGRKAVGYLEPEFSIPTTGATITEW